MEMTEIGEEPIHKLYRSRDDRIVAGVCGGLGDYFGVEPVIFRVLFLLLILQVGAGILLYLLLALIIPLEPVSRSEARVSRRDKIREFARDLGREVQTLTHRGWFANRRNMLGSIFILIGLSVLFSQLFPQYWFGWPVILPIVTILIGLYIILK